MDEYGIVSVNSQRILKTNEPFVLANQAKQVFYANDNKNKGWYVVTKTQPRDTYDIPKEMEHDGHDVLQCEESFSPRFISRDEVDNDGEHNWSRVDMEPTTIDTSSSHKKQKGKRKH